MRVFDHLIIGGGIAGTTAAETVRQRDASASIAIVGTEPHRLYSRVLLPHVLRGKASETQSFLRTPESYDDKRIVFLPGMTAIGLDTIARQVALADGDRIGYGKSLLIATGGAPRQVDCPGAAEADIMYFQTFDDTRRIAATAARRVTVIGGGFIALELHMSLASMGVKTVGVIRGEGFFSRTVGARGQALISDRFKAQGIELMTGVWIKAIESSAGIKRMRLTDGRSVESDAIAAGIGLEAGIEWLAGSGVTTARGIITDDHLRTNVPDVYAAGDVAETPDPVTGIPRLIGNWQNAMFQGRIAAANMTGADQRYETLTSYGVTCFGLPIAVIGAADSEGVRVSRDTAESAMQFVLDGRRIIAVSCVGLFPDRAAVTRLINDGTELTDSGLQALSDGRIPLASLVG